jgi:hypothetical protein
MFFIERIMLTKVKAKTHGTDQGAKESTNDDEEAGVGEDAGVDVDAGVEGVDDFKETPKYRRRWQVI